MKQIKVADQKFIKWESIVSGDLYYSLVDPIIKDIDGEKFMEVTPDFKHLALIKQDSVRKSGTVLWGAQDA